MKSTNFPFLFLFLLSLFSYAQTIPVNSIELDKFKKNKDLKIQLGMTTQEVRSVLGSPKAVEGGFPNSKEKLIHDFPEMVGQLNNSTWVYFYDPISVTLASAVGFYVNGQEVSESDYNSYKDLEYVYLYEGKVIDAGMGQGYKATRSNKLKVVSKDFLNTKFEVGQSYKEKVIPIYCVIFDKGTQSVASTIAYFMK